MFIRVVPVLLVITTATVPISAFADPPSLPVSDFLAPPPSLAPLPATPTTHLASYIAGGLALAAAGAATTFGVLAINEKVDYHREPTFSNADAGNNYAAYCDASIGATVLLAITSVALLLGSNDTHPSTPVVAHLNFTAAPLIAPHTAGASAALSF